MRKTNSANKDIREALEKFGVKQWELAEKAGYSQSWFCALMRKELPEGYKLELFTLIQKIAEEKEDVKGKSEKERIIREIARLNQKLESL